MILAILPVLAALTSADAVSIVLNSPSAVGPRTYAEAKARVEKEAALGRPLQQFVVGVTTDDKELAKRYLDASRSKIVEMAEKKDNSLAWYLLAKEIDDIALLEKAAEGGNVQALNALGTIRTNEALQNSDKMAFSGAASNTNDVGAVLRKCYGYFRRAAAQRDPNGFINLGTCYLRGLGCKTDLPMAFACFKAAAQAGHPEGMDYMSACYQFGHGVEKNSELSLYWSMRGRAARGNETAAKWLRERK